MNAYTKMVLIPQDEYYKLKSLTRDPITTQINSRLPLQMRQNSINKTISASQKEKPDFSYDEPSYDWDEFLDDQDRVKEEDFYLERWPSEIKEKIKDILTPRGRILNSARKPMPGSNINRVLNFLTSSTPKKGPSGYRKVAKTLAQRDAADIITHPRGARYAEEVERRILEEGEEEEESPSLESLTKDFSSKLQLGSGWSSIRKF